LYIARYFRIFCCALSSNLSLPFSLRSSCLPLPFEFRLPLPLEFRLPLALPLSLRSSSCLALPFSLCSNPRLTLPFGLRSSSCLALPFYFSLFWNASSKRNGRNV